jgi:hypothetical protein
MAEVRAMNKKLEILTEAIPLKERLDMVSDFNYGRLTVAVSTYVSDAKKQPMMEFLKLIADLPDFIANKLEEIGTPAFVSQEATPFNQPLVEMAPVGREEFLNVLRDQIKNELLMPSSKNGVFGGNMHSKPYYIKANRFNQFLISSMGSSSWPTLLRWDDGPEPEQELWAMIPVEGYYIFAGLTSLKIHICIWMEHAVPRIKSWEWEEGQSLPVDRQEFQKRIELL